MKFAFVLLLAASAALPSSGRAQTLSDVIQGVKELCELESPPSGSRQKLELDGRADGQMRVSLFGKAGLEGAANFTREEWEGVKQVLAKDQLADNEGRRACVQALTPVMLQKIK